MIDELAATLRRRGDRPALLTVTPTGRVRAAVRYAQLADLADGYAEALRRRGLSAGDTVGVALRPGGRALAVMLAAHRLGLRLAVLDPSAGPDVLRARLTLADPALILADAAAQAVAGWARPLARRAANLALPDLGTLGPVATIGRRLPGCAPPLSAAVQGRGSNGGSGPGLGVAGPARADGDANRGTGGGGAGDADAVIVFTSGTTDRPRAVVHSRSGLDAGMRAVAGLVRPERGTPVLAGTFFALIPALAAGAPVALPARSDRGLVRQLRALEPRITYLTPPRLRGALRACARFTGRVWSGSAPVSATLLSRLKRAGAEEAWGVYALTEMFPAAAVEEAEKAAFDGDGDLVGEPLPGVRAEVDAGGELLLAGPNGCDRYLGEERPGRVRTGDIARLDRRAGRPRIVLAGRCKDMILSGADNIYPGLYEPALHVPGVSLAVLVGVPADDLDERVVAVIEPEPGADAHRIRSALRPALARMGNATPTELLFASVPLSGRSGKPDRRETARLAAAMLAAGAGAR
jgi:olefin beta-lactone synthetase